MSWCRRSPQNGGGVIDDSAGTQEDWRAATVLGGFPVPAHLMTDPDARATWFSGYVQTYLERDLQALRAVESLTDFRRLMRAACLRIGGLLNQTELGRDVGISQPQVHRFMNLMEFARGRAGGDPASHVIFGVGSGNVRPTSSKPPCGPVAAGHGSPWKNVDLHFHLMPIVWSCKYAKCQFALPKSKRSGRRIKASDSVKPKLGRMRQLAPVLALNFDPKMSRRMVPWPRGGSCKVPASLAATVRG